MPYTLALTLSGEGIALVFFIRFFTQRANEKGSRNVPCRVYTLIVCKKIMILLITYQFMRLHDIDLKRKKVNIYYDTNNSTYMKHITQFTLLNNTK